MDDYNKEEFKKEHGIDRYLIAESHNLWDLHPKCLRGLECTLSNYLNNLLYPERKKELTSLERFYIKTFKLRDLDTESLLDLDKVITYLWLFRSENFENQEIFKRKIITPLFF